MLLNVFRAWAICVWLKMDKPQDCIVELQDEHPGPNSENFYCSEMNEHHLNLKKQVDTNLM